METPSYCAALFFFQVCVLTSHVCAFGDVKFKQHKALFSINNTNSQDEPPIPTILVGDFNRFLNEQESFKERLTTYNLLEAKPKMLVIPSSSENLTEKTFKDDDDIGTFQPWPTDVEVYEDMLREPLSKSRLDVQLCTDNSRLIEVKDIYIRASMYKSLPESKAPDGINAVRHLLNCTMSSDHLALVGSYEIKS